MDYSSDYVFTLFYFIFSIGLIYPSTEFISAGVTIPHIFQNLLGNEHETFIAYHIKKSYVTLQVYSLLPLGYILLSCIFGNTDEVGYIKILILHTHPQILGLGNIVFIFYLLEDIRCFIYSISSTQHLSDIKLVKKWFWKSSYSQRIIKICQQ